MAVKSAYIARKGSKPEKGDKSAGKNSGFSSEEELRAYNDMLLIRRFEEKAGQLYGMGSIGGFCHLYIGQEAVVVGMQMAIREGDQVITTYRDHGHMLSSGMDPKGVMAELTGRRDGYSHGKGGSMHMFSREKQFFGGHGIVGAQVPLGAGLAFANKYRGNDHVALTYYGDGAANQGQVYETFNIASVWKLPVIFVIENNRYAMGTAAPRSTAKSDHLGERGEAFDIPSEQVDGMDVRAVKESGDRAVEHCRSGEGPYILEMMTYRYRGHSMSDPAKYRSKEEVEKWQEKDPIARLGVALLDRKFAKPKDLEALDKDVNLEVDDCIKFAEESPWPPPEYMYEDIYVKTPHINWRAVENDPAWASSLPDDRVPVAYPPHVSTVKG